MDYGIGRYHKPIKNIKPLEYTTDTYSAPSTPLYCHKKLNRNTDITSKKSLTAETHYIEIFTLEYKPSDIIKKYMHPTHTQKTCCFQIFLFIDVLSF